MSQGSHQQGVEAAYGLSPLQQGMLFHHLLEPSLGVDIEQMVCTLREPLDAAKLRAAWEKVVARHAILRTRFVWEGHDQPMQEVHRVVSMPFLLEDWREVSATAQTAKLSAFLKTDRVRGFTMSEAPMLRLALFRCGDAHFELVWTFHHALLDGRSFPIVLNEVFGFYEASLRGEEINPPLPRPYRDYIEWLQGLDPAKAESFWRATLKNFGATSPLVVDQQRQVAGGESRQGDQEVWLSAADTAALQTLAKENEFTFNTIVQGAWALILHRYSGEDEVVFGATRACRRAALEGADEMVGLFINTLPVRVKLDPDEALLPWLKRLREQWVAMRDFEHTPLVKVQSWSEAPPGMALFDSIVVFENFLLNTSLQAQGGRWASRAFRLYEQTNFPLTLAVYLGDELGLKMEFDRSRFDDMTILRMLGHLKTVLAGIAANPKCKLGDLPLLTAAERHELLVERNLPSASYPPSQCLHELFEAQAAQTPDAIALTCGQTRLTYRDLNEHSNQLAHLLRSLGVGPDVIVGICIDRSLEMVVAILGILKSGGAYLPIDLSYPKDRLAFMLEDAQAPVLLTQKKLIPDLPAHRARVICLDDPQPAALGSQPTTNPQSQTTPANLAYVIFTSGSTGRPKGCAITHHNVVRLMQATDHWYHFNEGDVWTLFHSYAFDFSVWEIWGALLFGGRLVVVPYLVSRSPEAFYELLADEKVTVLNQTPSAFRQLIQAEEDAPRELSLRYVIFGGEALEMQSLKPWFERHGDVRPQLVNMYGITETTVHVTYRPLTATDVQAASVIGVPIPDLQVYILDQRRQPVPIGVPGEMFVGGAGLARGYINRPELTADRFIPNPFNAEPGVRLYKTGDLARFLPGRDIEYLGRIDHQVKIRGFRIELGEIESVLCQHEAVREAVVLAREDGPGGKRLVAYLTAENGRKPSVADLRGHLKFKVPEYMVPGAFVVLDKLPLTGNGKVDRKALPAPEHDRPDLAAGYAPPSNPVERSLAAIWAKVLRIERVGVHDNFFELGGDSILSIQVISLARREGFNLSPKLLFQRPTVAELAAAATPADAMVSAAEQGLVTGSAPLTPIQHWFFEQNLAEPGHYNQAFLFALKQPLQADVLKRALVRLEEHHDALRVRFDGSARPVAQRFAREAGVPLFERIDLSDLPDDQLAARIEIVAAKAQGVLNYVTGPLWSVVFFDLAPERSGRLFIAIHHLAVDGVSWRILLEDLETAYQCELGGRPVSFPRRTTSAKDWARRLDAAAKGGDFSDETLFWRETVLAAPHPLPVDSSDGENTELSARTAMVRLDADETAALLQRTAAAYNTQINDLLLTALAQTIVGWTGGKGLLVNLEGHGREDVFDGVDVSRTLGWFTTIYPVRLKLTSSEPGLALKSVKEQLRAIPRRGFGYGVLRYLTADESLPTGADAQIVFNYFGQFDQVVAGSSLFRFAQEPTGPWHSPRAKRTHLIEVNAMVVDGSLQVAWTYSANRHQSPTIENLAAQYLKNLQGLVAHCASARARGATPSDFPLATLDQSELDALLARVGDWRDVYRLSPIQTLFYAAAANDSRAVLDQWHCTLSGPLDVEILGEAWKLVLQRHPALRTSFQSAGLREPVQVVHQNCDPPWTIEDWRESRTGESEVRWRQWLIADKSQGMPLDRSPLSRFAAIRMADDQSRFVWTVPALLLDGWSWPLVFRDLSIAYDALSARRVPQFEGTRGYRDYVAWLASRNHRDAEAYWTRTLAGVVAPTPLIAEPPALVTPGGEVRAEWNGVLGGSDAQMLVAFARQLRITPNTLFQAAWSLVLARLSGKTDVVFGAAFSGRPTDLPGAGGIVGPFVNHLPVRVSLKERQTVRDFLGGMHEQLLEMNAHQFTPLSQIQSWSEVPWRHRLFDSILVVQNYAVDDAARRLGKSIQISDFIGPIHSNFPLLLLVEPATEWRVKMVYDTREVAPIAVARWGEGFLRVLKALAGEPGLEIGTLIGQLTPPFEGKTARKPWRVPSQNYIAPQSEMEQKIAAVWQDLLGLDRISVEENVFDLGVHSMLLVRLHQRMRDSIKHEFPLVSMFQFPTIQSLAKHLSGAGDRSRGEDVHRRAALQRTAMAKQRPAAIRK